LIIFENTKKLIDIVYRLFCYDFKKTRLSEAHREAKQSVRV
jgi:hypothetical protein